MGLNLGGVFKSFLNPTTLLSIATMNPALIAMSLTKQLASQIGQELIASFGKELGLPSAVIDMAQGAFASSMGDTQGARQNFQEAAGGVSELLNSFFDEFNVGPVDRGNVERSANSLEKLISQMFRDALEQHSKEQENERDRASGTSKPGKDGSAVIGELGISGGFLVQFAMALGETMDKKMEDMMLMAGKINEEGAKKLDKDDPNALTERQSNIQVYSSVLQGLGQELNTLSQALSNALNYAGEAQQSLARKG